MSAEDTREGAMRQPRFQARGNSQTAEETQTMKAITTTYHGPTNTRGSRIVASAPDNPRRTYPWNYDNDSEINHRDAAYAYALDRDWTGRLAGGWTGKAYVWVFVPRDEEAPYRWHDSGGSAIDRQRTSDEHIELLQAFGVQS